MSLITETSLLAFFPAAPGTGELLIVAIIALLLFGKRLPEVARSLGKGIVEFKKGVRGIEDEVTSSTYKPEASRPAPRETHAEVTAPKFEPPKSEPASSESASTEETSHA
ncbi:MAG: twin-arginine translocase TatA/TatE family subunit [Planctomycetota bacterium]|nr:twin-arginine translocase TatA/TatE family subunit [Planctomycetota bacterium]MDA1212374.1 twin-arginine translocase TatA/TatE family subunit [Planctomycetota bacterium]